MSFAPSRLLTALLAVALSAVFAAALPAHALDPVEPKLTAELERLYASWKSAMSSRNLTAWARTTARARQMMVRNSIVSQKREWPRSLFSLAMNAPEIRGLRLAGTQRLGPQARLVYHGKIDFQLDDPRTPPDAVLVLDFVQEPAGWRFFGSRYFNFKDHPVEATKISQGDLGFLNRTDMAFTGRAPAVPPPCPVPDYAGQIRVASFGYTTRVALGDHHRSTVSGQATTDVIIGGLRRGTSRLILEVEPILEVPAEERSLEISVFALTPTLKTRASRVLHFTPNNPVAPRQEVTVTVGPSTMQQGNEMDLIPSGQ